MGSMTRDELLKQQRKHIRLACAGEEKVANSSRLAGGPLNMLSLFSFKPTDGVFAKPDFPGVNSSKRCRNSVALRSALFHPLRFATNLDSACLWDALVVFLWVHVWFSFDFSQPVNPSF